MWPFEGIIPAQCAISRNFTVDQPLHGTIIARSTGLLCYLHDPVGSLKSWKDDRGDLDQQPADDGIGHTYPEDVAAPQFREEGVSLTHEPPPGSMGYASEFSTEEDRP